MGYLCHFTNVGWITLLSLGATGGILICWDKDKVDCVESWVDVFSVSIVAAVKGETQKWVLIGVYGSMAGDRLEIFLAELQAIRGRRELPWCIRGDFNEVLYLEERSRTVRRSRGMDDFCEFIDQNELINLPISGA